MNLKNETSCKHKSSSTLMCTLSGELDNYGFKSWIHEMNGNFIRTMSGLVNGHRSILVIHSCTYEDGGEYTCVAWNEVMHTKYFANKTTTLTINSKFFFISNYKRIFTYLKDTKIGTK